ncbi:uncharacterized protein LOC116111215 [Pistacia vera]|uniref:uncharacterized protein LOC116111215 n=1 Tax=Pistacia vera TaxID=55513 RepID=UPI0012637BD9|nr:uncharacterized protein LOC116111215 [Pistacia vera]
MAFLIFPKRKLFILTSISIAILSCCHSGYADENPAERVAQALWCFNNRFIYSGCDEAYRLNESGILNVPFEATDSFCRGPCLAETHYVLNCVDRVLSNFIFSNKATVRDIRTAVNMGCSYSTQRGNFNWARYIQGVTGSAQKVANFNTFNAAFAILAGTCFLML